MYVLLNSSIVVFKEKLNDVSNQVSHKPCYTIGDCSNDLQKPDNHLQTEEFLDHIHSNSLIHMIY